MSGACGVTVDVDERLTAERTAKHRVHDTVPVARVSRARATKK
jgi:hypothetical protein